MADTKVTDFGALAGADLASGDLIPVIDVSASGISKNKSMTAAEAVVGLAAQGLALTTRKLDDFGATDDNTDLDATTLAHGLMPKADKSKLDGIESGADVTDAANVGSSINGATAKVTPVDADTMPLIDSAASNVLKKVTWANIKATLKSYFDTLYGTINAFVGDSGSGGTKGDVPAPAAGDAAAGKFLKADGTWAVPAGGGGTITGTDEQVLFFNGANTPAGDSGFTYNHGTASATLGGNLTVNDDPYDATGWDTNNNVPTKNAVRDKIESLAQADITGLKTADSPQFAEVNVGHASDTTITRVSAGVLAVEGKTLLTTDNIDDTAYDATTWNGVTTIAPSKNAVRDIIETVNTQAFTEIICIPCSDLTTALTTGTAKGYWSPPWACTVTGVRAYVKTAPTGAALQVDINEGASSILSTKITIDVSENDSLDAATPPVVSDSSLAAKSAITVDIDQIGSTIAGAGLFVEITVTHS